MLYPMGLNIRYLVGYWDIDVTNHLNRQFFYVSFFEKHITINTIIIIITSPSPSFSHMLNDCLVGGIPTPLKNMSSSVGMMKFPIYGTRWSPRTRMLTRMLMAQMSKHMVMQSRTIPFCNSLFEQSCACFPCYQSAVWSGKCRVWSVECEVRSVECKVWSGECRVCKV